MSKPIPLIRAGALIPMLRWMTKNHRPINERLAEADLRALSFVDPDTPIPLRNAAAFFRNAERDEGPDIACRVVGENSIQELALVGRVVLGAHTPRAALDRVVSMLPYHSSHEIMTVTEKRSGIEVGQGWRIHLDDLTLHVIQQFFVAIIIRVCSLTLAPKPLLSFVEMVPHPEFGFSHLKDRFCILPTASQTRFVKLGIDASVSGRRFFRIARDREIAKTLSGMKPLTQIGGLGDTAKVVIRLQLEDGHPSIDRLAMAAGTSRRTLQRQLATEGTSFSALLEETRRDLALQELETGSKDMRDVTQRLGYADQSTLSRAVRRWTGQTPSDLVGR